MKGIKLLLAFLLCWAGGRTDAQTIAEKLDALVISSSVLNTSEVGIAVYDLTDDVPVYRYQANKLYRPASIEKVITSVTALSELGKDYDYATRLAYTGSIEAGRVKGGFYVVGGFDPWVFEEDLLALGDLGYRAGIRRIDGRLVGGVSMKNSVYLGGGWAWGGTPEGF